MIFSQTWRISIKTSIVFVAFWSVIQSLNAGDQQSTYDDLGQKRIRQRWHEIQDENQKAAFLRSHRMVDLAEDFWGSGPERQTADKSGPSSDVFVAEFLANQSLRENPLKFSVWIPAYLHLASLMLDRVWDALWLVTGWLDHGLVLLTLLMAMILIFHLWIWNRVLVADAPSWLRLHSRLTLFTALTALAFSSWITASFLWSLHLLFCLTLSYSRTKTPLAVAGFLSALLLSLAPYAGVFIETQQLGAIHEGLQLGRTRIEFSPSVLQRLTPLQKAMWSFQNQDYQATQHWLAQAPSGFEKEVLSLDLESSNLSALEMIQRSENLLKNHPNQDLLKFNLVQLYIKTQQLVKADRLRGEINPRHLLMLEAWSRKQQRDWISPQNDPLQSAPLTFFKNRLFDEFQHLGLLPFEWPSGFFYLITFLLPWFLFAMAFHHRRKASGLCQFTSDSTPSPEISVSAIYQSAMLRRDPSSQAFRAEIDQATRAFSTLKNHRVRLWNLWMPGAHELVHEDALVRPFIKSLLVYGLIWWALPLSIRFQIADFFHFSIEPQFGSDQIFWPSLLVGIAFWLYFQLELLRKVDR